MIRLVYFDFGGVLTQSGKRGFIANSLGALYGVPPEALDIEAMHLALRRGTASEEVLFDTLNQRYGKQVTPQMFVQYTHADFVPSAEVYRLAKRMRAHGIRTGILSNVFGMNGKQLKRDGWYDGFDPLILSYETGYAKPDAEFYDLAVERAGVSADEILFIDDQDKCLPPARKLGIHVLQAHNPGQIVDDAIKLIKHHNDIDI